MSLVAFLCVTYHSSAAKITTAARYYTTASSSSTLGLQKASMIPFSQKGINPIKQLQGTSKLIKTIQVFVPYLLQHLYATENNENYNKHKWKPVEKDAMATALNWIAKKPMDVTKQDLTVLSFLVKTRSPVQCHRFLQYRIKNQIVTIY